MDFKNLCKIVFLSRIFYRNDRRHIRKTHCSAKDDRKSDSYFMLFYMHVDIDTYTCILQAFLCCFCCFLICRECEWRLENVMVKIFGVHISYMCLQYYDFPGLKCDCMKKKKKEKNLKYNWSVCVQHTEFLVCSQSIREHNVFDLDLYIIFECMYVCVWDA